MKKQWCKAWGTAFCASFTCMVLIIIGIESLYRGEITRDYGNILLCFFWTGIAILTLSLYPLLEKLPLILICILQYSIAMGVVMLSIKWGSAFTQVHPNAYRDAFRSFTLFYALGAMVFYVMERKSVQKQNKILDNIKELKRKKD